MRTRNFVSLLSGALIGSTMAGIVSVSGTGDFKLTFITEEGLNDLINKKLDKLNGIKAAGRSIASDVLKDAMFFACKALLSRNRDDITKTGPIYEIACIMKDSDYPSNDAKEFISDEVISLVNEALNLPPSGPMKDRPDLDQNKAEKLISENKGAKESIFSKIWRYAPLTNIVPLENLEWEKRLGKYYYSRNLGKIYDDPVQVDAVSSRIHKEATDRARELDWLKGERLYELGLYLSRNLTNRVNELNSAAANDNLINGRRSGKGWDDLFGAIFSPNTYKNIAYILFLTFSKKFVPIVKVLGSAANKTRDIFINFFGRRLNIRNWRIVLDGLEGYLYQNMIGQIALIRQVVDRMREYFAMAEACAIAGVPFNKGLRIILRGDPGIGKTYLVQLIACYLNVECALINMDDIVDDRGLQTSTIVDRLLKPKVVDKWFGKNEIQTRLAQILSNNPQGTLIFLDETDKMNAWERQKQGVNTVEILKSGGKLPATTLQELLRVYVDEGKIGKKDARFCMMFEGTNASRQDINNNESSIANRELMAVIDVYPPSEQDLKKFCIDKLKEIIEASHKRDGLTVVWDENDLNAYTKFLASVKANFRLAYILVQKWTLAVLKFHEAEENRGKKAITVHWDREKGLDGIYVTGE